MHLNIRNLSLQLDGKSLYKNFCLEVAQGEKVLIKGPSGSGKSTLFRLILGFMQPDEGAIYMDGQALSPGNVWSLRRRMAYVSQELNVGSAKVKDFIRDVFDYRANRHLEYEEEKTLRYFKQFDLEPEKLEQDFGKLSGGEKQRVALIIALLLDRELYLLDEVTSAIDEALREKVIQYLAGLEEKTMIIISHDPGWEQYDFRKFELKNNI